MWSQMLNILMMITIGQTINVKLINEVRQNYPYNVDPFLIGDTLTTSKMNQITSYGKCTNISSVIPKTTDEITILEDMFVVDISGVISYEQILICQVTKFTKTCSRSFWGYDTIDMKEELIHPNYHLCNQVMTTGDFESLIEIPAAKCSWMYSLEVSVNRVTLRVHKATFNEDNTQLISPYIDGKCKIQEKKCKAIGDYQLILIPPKVSEICEITPSSKSISYRKHKHGSEYLFSDNKWIGSTSSLCKEYLCKSDVIRTDFGIHLQASLKMLNTIPICSHSTRHELDLGTLLEKEDILLQNHYLKDQICNSVFKYEFKHQMLDSLILYDIEGKSYLFRGTKGKSIIFPYDHKCTISTKVINCIFYYKTGNSTSLYSDGQSFTLTKPKRMIVENSIISSKYRWKDNQLIDLVGYHDLDYLREENKLLSTLHTTTRHNKVRKEFVFRPVTKTLGNWDIPDTFFWLFVVVLCITIFVGTIVIIKLIFFICKKTMRYPMRKLKQPKTSPFGTQLQNRVLRLSDLEQ